MFKLTEIGTRESNQFGIAISTPFEYYDIEECHYNNLHFNWFKKSYWFKIPMLLKPVAKNVSYTNSDGSNHHYIDHIQKNYGVSTFEDSIHVSYGIQPGCWTRDDPKNSDHTKVFSIPWLTLNFQNKDYYNGDGTFVMRTYPDAQGRTQHSMEESAQNLVKPLEFRFQDYDGALINAKVTCSVLTYRRFNSWLGWLGYFLPRVSYRRINIDFDNETGNRKGSYKGGTTSTSYLIDDDVSLFNAFHHYAYANGFKNVVSL